ncbi:SprT family protein [Planococcus halotolerans]|uniref:Protein SprT-like n=1 Tax=Planococcus halotolerans TaxID=2233542 RepID=A0A365KRJ5_9BACL|nr:SprT family protein [Planococcus halotolerans]QHJ69241.1 SprT family protein [Planococcus halotolerans]RAZ75781.1 SprT family protein [Planococcus halotolerans]
MTDYELTGLIKEISETIFKKPFIHKGVFNSRLRTTGGRYMLRSHNIEINPSSYEKFGYKELEGIIKHELCHYHLHLEGKGYKHRDADFRNLLQQTGSPRFCSHIEQNGKRQTTKRYIYQCVSCQTDYSRKIRMNTERYRCGRCAGKLAMK